MHPAVKECGLRLISGDQLQSTNQVTVAILLAVFEVIKDFKPEDKALIWHQQLTRHLYDQIFPYFEKCRRLLSGTQNALTHFKTQLSLVIQESDSLEQLRPVTLQKIDSFIDNRILYAQDLLLSNGTSIISEKREETLLVYGNHET